MFLLPLHARLEFLTVPANSSPESAPKAALEGFITLRRNFSSLHVTAGIEEPKEPEEHSVAQRLLEEDVEEATDNREKIIADSRGTDKVLP